MTGAWRHACAIELGGDAARSGLDQEWEELAEHVHAPPFLRPGWFRAWCSAFAGGALRVLTVRRGGTLAGVLPLLSSRGLMLSAANWHSPVYGPTLADETVAGELAEAMLARRARRTDLTMLDGHDPVLTVLSAHAAARQPTIKRLVARQPYLDLSEGSDAFEQGLPRKLRKEISRLRRRLDEQGAVEFVVRDGTEQLDKLLRAGFAIEGSGWKTDRGTAIVSQQKTLSFYTDVARWAAERGWLRLAFLMLDERPIAFDFCVESDGVTYVLKGGFDPDFRRFGPGTLLTWESILHAFGQQLSSYEFLGSDAAYKRVWATSVRERWRFQTFGRSAGGLLELAAWRHGRPIAARALSVVRPRNA